MVYKSLEHMWAPYWAHTSICPFYFRIKPIMSESVVVNLLNKKPMLNILEVTKSFSLKPYFFGCFWLIVVNFIF
jgi:hypothetical protein